jgi:hypothetical protein
LDASLPALNFKLIGYDDDAMQLHYGICADWRSSSFYCHSIS